MSALMQGVTAPQSSAGSGPPSLRPYQHASVHAVESEFARGFRSTLLVAATGTGKTVTGAELVRREVARGGKVLFLVNRDELVRQTKRKCESVGLWPDIEKASQRANTLAKVVIASVQTLRGKRLERWARGHFTLVIVDEAHHAVAAGYVAILSHFDGARVVGVTATPDRADGKALGDVFATVAYRYEIRQAIAEGYLVPIIARRVIVESIDLSTVGMRAGDFAQDQLSEVMGDERALRGQAVPLLELAGTRLTIAFCVDVAHAEALSRVLNQLRPGCARAVSGKTDDEEREEMLAAHARGDFQFLVNCDVLVEGYDCPEVACVAVVRPTRSRGRFVQCGGRGLRPAPWIGKRDCLILTFGDDKVPGLCGPADCLAGRDELADDERAEIDRLIATRQLEIGEVIDQAKSEIERRRASMRIAAVVKYHEENIDPFIGAPDGAGATAPPCDPAWETQPPSQRQLEMLESDRFGVTTSKLPASFSRADAWRLLFRIKARNDSTLCSYKAAKKLAAAGVRDTKNLPRERAKQLLDLLREGGWKARAIANEPECKGPSDVEWGAA